MVIRRKEVGISRFANNVAILEKTDDKKEDKNRIISHFYNNYYRKIEIFNRVVILLHMKGPTAKA